MSMRRILIKGGRLLDPHRQLDAGGDLYIANGRIIAQDQAPDGFTADQVIDASGLWVMPGLVDLSARLREPGQEHKCTIASETRAAASAGVTTLCVPPDTNPMVDTPAVARLIRQRAKAAGFARVLPIAALTQGLKGEHISEMAALKEAGCVGVYNTTPIANTAIQRRAMEYAATFDLTLFLNPVDQWLAKDGCAHEGKVASRLGLPGIPEAAETTAVARDLALVDLIGVRSHFCRLSSDRARRMIARARYDGLPVSADVAMHQLFFTEMDIDEFNALFHVMPPLRTQRDRDGLREGVSDGNIGVITSDHQPHEADAKQAPFCATEPGMSALETLLPLTLRLVQDGVMPLLDALHRITRAPAEVIQQNLGTLQVGQSADVVIVDPEAVWAFDCTRMRSQGKNAPYQGWEFKGKVKHTLFAGKLVYSDAG